MISGATVNTEDFGPISEALLADFPFSDVCDSTVQSDADPIRLLERGAV